jgi:Protein of Unknown function (DUF2784)
MWYHIAADLVIVVHLLFIGFVVGGVFLAWRWPRVSWAHLPAVVYGALVEFVGFTCPLTLLENDLRRATRSARVAGPQYDVRRGPAGAAAPMARPARAGWLPG